MTDAGYDEYSKYHNRNRRIARYRCRPCKVFSQPGYNVVATSCNVTRSQHLPASPKLALVDDYIGDAVTAANVAKAAIDTFGSIDTRPEQRCGRARRRTFARLPFANTSLSSAKVLLDRVQVRAIGGSR